ENASFGYSFRGRAARPSANASGSRSLLMGLFSQEIGSRQQHVMAKDFPAPGPAFAHAAAIVARAQLGQDMAAGRIVIEPAGMDALLVQLLKGIGHKTAGGLGGKALAPERRAQPVAELQPTHALLQPDAAHEQS